MWAGDNRDGGAADDAARRVGGGEGLVSGRDERDPGGEGVRAIVRGLEGVIGWQDSPRIGTGKAHGAGVARGDVAVGIQGRDRDVEGRARDGGRRGRDQHTVGISWYVDHSKEAIPSRI